MCRENVGVAAHSDPLFEDLLKIKWKLKINIDKIRYRGI